MYYKNEIFSLIQTIDARLAAHFLKKPLVATFDARVINFDFHDLQMLLIEIPSIIHFPTSCKFGYLSGNFSNE